MKKALLVLLVIVVIITGLPVMMGHAGMATCHDCGPAVMAGGICAAALPLATVVFAGLIAFALRRRDDELRSLLVVLGIDRPPR